MAKQLPPSASDLRLLDIGGIAGDTLQEVRPDISVQVASLKIADWSFEANSMDAVVAYDNVLRDDLLQAVLTVMREGGRLIVINPVAEVSESWVQTLEDAGYIRILVEPAVDDLGVLIRGEKAHTTDDTLARVEATASRDADALHLDTYRGRYVHLLIIETPNIPAWKRTPDDPLFWHAIAVTDGDTQRLLAFSSLPKAVSFMQAAIIAGFVQDVNKVGKFSKSVAGAWSLSTILNPTLDQVAHYQVQQLEIDPDTAEAPDE